MRQGIFLPASTFQCRLSYGVSRPPCTTACINICVHVEDPVVHVSVRWITETLKHPACTVGWVERLCRRWLSPGKEIPDGTIQMFKKTIKKKKKNLLYHQPTSFSFVDVVVSGVVLLSSRFLSPPDNMQTISVYAITVFPPDKCFSFQGARVSVFRVGPIMFFYFLFLASSSCSSFPVTLFLLAESTVYARHFSHPRVYFASVA